MRDSMLKRISAVTVIGAMAAGLVVSPATSLSAANRPGPEPRMPERVQPTAPASASIPLPALHRLPLQFEANVGQAPAEIRYLARVGQHRFYVTDRDAVIDLRAPNLRPKAMPRNPVRRNASATERSLARMKGAYEAGERGVVRMQFVGGAPSRPVVEQKLPGVVHYYYGKDPKHWRTNVPTFGRVLHRGVYPGIDVVYYGGRGELEYDFVLAPGADPRQIRIAFRGAENPTIAANGELVLTVEGRTIRQRRPVLYQEIAGLRRPVQGRYLLAANGDVRFEVGSYVASLPLVIDPSFIDLGNGVNGLAERAVGDPSGNTLVTGSTPSLVPLRATTTTQQISGASTSIPVLSTSGFATTGSAVLVTTDGGGNRVTKTFSYDGLDGTQFQNVTGIGAAETYAAGTTVMPPTPCAEFPDIPTDAFVAKLRASDNAPLWTVYLGGRASGFGDCTATFGLGIALDATGANAIVVGQTNSKNLVITDGTNVLGTPGAFQPVLGDSDEVANDPNLYQSGGDAFVIKLSSAGTLAYATYLGGDSHDFAQAVVVDGAGNAYVTGGTQSTVFPAQYDGIVNTDQAGGGYSDLFVAKVSPTGSVVGFLSLQGGSGDDAGIGIALNSQGEVVVTGDTLGVFVGEGEPQARLAVESLLASADIAVPLRLAGIEAGLSACELFVVDFPGSTSPLGGGIVKNTPLCTDVSNAVIAKFSAASGAPSVAYLVGGEGEDTSRGVGIDASNNVYITGQTASTNFPVKNPIKKDGVADPAVNARLGFDAFVVKVALPVGTQLATSSNVAYSSPLGGSGDEQPTGIAVTATGTVYLTGVTNSTDTAVLPKATTTDDVANTDAYLLAIPPPASPTAAPVVTETNQTNLGTLEQSGTPPALTISTDVDGNIVIAGAPTGSLGAKITVTINAEIDVKPRVKKNYVNLRARYVHVAILSTPTFDAPSRVDPATLTFGKTGSEASVVTCGTQGRDVNRDRLVDLVCTFRVSATNFSPADKSGFLKGKTKAGADIEGNDGIHIVPPRKNDPVIEHDADDAGWTATDDSRGSRH